MQQPLAGWRAFAAASLFSLGFSFLVPVHAAEPPPPPSQPSTFGSGKPLELQGRDLLRKLREHIPRAPERRQRKALAVITDFADVKLEDWQGAGYNSSADVRVTLDLMEEHWAWLSHGRESVDWDIIRITLPQALAPDAFPGGWPDFRRTAGELIRQQVNVADYDLDRDGSIDSAWLVVANQDRNYDYLIGGTSSNGGVNLFVDGQASLSVVSGAYGNFNHEFGHTLGLPDLYGEYDTQHYLTLMSDSWPVPPQDFTAYERSLLGWVKPRVLTPGRHRVSLRVATDSFDAVRISTGRPEEFFLIEYRRRPDSGFSSVAPRYDGLTVLHLLEGSSQFIDPPLMKLEPADGFIATNQPPDLDDFFFPGNDAMRLPYTLRSHFGGIPVAQITAVRRESADRLSLELRVFPLVPAGLSDLLLRNRLSNPSFEQGNGLPADWLPDFFAPTSQFSWEKGRAYKGRRSVSVSSPAPNDARWVQTVNGLTPGRGYQFCGRLRGKDIATNIDAPVGGNLSLMGSFILSPSRSGSFDWTRTCLVFEAEIDSLTLACRLGFYGSTVTGKLWCDDMRLVPLKSAFPQTPAALEEASPPAP